MIVGCLADSLACFINSHRKVDLGLVANLKNDVFSGQLLKAGRLDGRVTGARIETDEVINSYRIRSYPGQTAHTLITEFNRLPGNYGSKLIVNRTTNLSRLGR